MRGDGTARLPASLPGTRELCSGGVPAWQCPPLQGATYGAEPGPRPDLIRTCVLGGLPGGPEHGGEKQRKAGSARLCGREAQSRLLPAGSVRSFPGALFGRLPSPSPRWPGGAMSQVLAAHMTLSPGYTATKWCIRMPKPPLQQCSDHPSPAASPLPRLSQVPSRALCSSRAQDCSGRQTPHSAASATGTFVTGGLCRRVPWLPGDMQVPTRGLLTPRLGAGPPSGHCQGPRVSQASPFLPLIS